MDLPALVCRYADRFAALGKGEHHVGSPLGAWLVVALAAPTAIGELAEQITDALGTDADSAHQAAADLLTRGNRAVSTAAAAWARPDLTGLAGWQAELPAKVQTGPVPTQDEADAWARKHTFGLISRFPLEVTNVVILLASTLATRVTWLTPFEIADAAELRGPWSSRLTRALRMPREGGHHAFITDTTRAGRVAAHIAMADDLDVTSVLAEPGVAPADVLAAAHEISVGQHRDTDRPRRVSLFDLPLGEHPLWTITETQERQRGEEVQAVLPAWHAATKHDLLTVPELGFQAAGDSLRRLAEVPGDVEAAQSAVARYSRRGFEAAALTALGLALSARVPPPPGPHRTATFRFAHPYAVVATTHGREPDDPWRGLPVFAAWITDPDDAQD